MASTLRLSYRNFPTHNALRYPLSSALCYFFKLNFAQQIANSSIYKTLFVNGKPVTAIGTNLPTFLGQSTFGWEAMLVKIVVNITLTHLITALSLQLYIKTSLSTDGCFFTTLSQLFCQFFSQTFQTILNFKNLFVSIKIGQRTGVSLQGCHSYRH